MIGIAPLLGDDSEPSDIAAVVAWWDPTDADYISTSGSDVTSLTDRIGGLVLTPFAAGTVDYSPANTNLGNQATLVFTGVTNGFLRATSVPSNFPLQAGTTITVVMVTHLSPLGGSAPCVFSLPGWGVGLCGRTPDAPAQGAAQACSGGAFRAYETNGLISDISAVVVWQAGPSGHALWVNGAAQTLVTPTNGYPGSAATEIAIGARRTGTTEYVTGAVGDVIVAGALTTDQRQQLERYAAGKYGITLPAGHS